MLFGQWSGLKSSIFSTRSKTMGLRSDSIEEFTTILLKKVNVVTFIVNLGITSLVLSVSFVYNPDFLNLAAVCYSKYLLIFHTGFLSHKWKYWSNNSETVNKIWSLIHIYIRISILYIAIRCFGLFFNAWQFVIFVIIMCLSFCSKLNDIKSHLNILKIILKLYINLLRPFSCFYE